MNNDRICCEVMCSQLTHKCDQHADQLNCPDVVIVYDPVFDEYKMPIRDGGTSSITVLFCPWCGTEMSPSKRDLWFETLADLGFDDPAEQPIPSEFRTDVWWRNLP